MKRTIGFVLTLAGCVADTPVTSSNTQPYVEYVNAFGSVCLAENLSQNSARAAADESGVGFLGLPDYYLNDATSTGIMLTGRTTGGFDRDKAYTSYTCIARFRGTWADEIFPDVQEKLASAGFVSISRFDRKAYSPEKAYDGKEIVTIAGRVSRSGKSFVVSITQSPPGGEITSKARISYISNTEITISSVSSN